MPSIGHISVEPGEEDRGKEGPSPSAPVGTGMMVVIRTRDVGEGRSCSIYTLKAAIDAFTGTEFPDSG